MDAANTGKGGVYSIVDDKGPKNIILFQKNGVFLSSVYNQQTPLENKIFGKASFMIVTKNGEMAIAASQTKMIVFSIKKNSVIFEGDFNYLYSVTISPSEKYLQILDKINMNEGRTLLFELPSMNMIKEFEENQFTGYYNKQAYPLIRFSSDDCLYFRYNNKLLEVYSSTHQKVRQIKSGILEHFEISKVSNAEVYVVACIYLDKKNNEGYIHLYNEKNDQAFYKKNIKKAEQIKVRFSPTSNKFLMELQTYYDPTGKSYYGEFGLYLFNDVSNKISRVKFQSGGPVHDFSWSLDGMKFITIQGFMPASCLMFTQNNEQIFQFGKKHRNTICWGNLGRFVCLAGFGNLNGEMDIWDLEKKQKLGYCQSSSASYCQWSPDDRKILTCIVTPRLRVDNCYKVFAYSGTQLFKANYDQTQLYGVHWVHPTNFQCNPRGASPGRKLENQPKKEEGKFKTFSSSLNFGAVTLGQKPHQPKQPKLAPGQHPDDLVQKKKRKRKPKEPESLNP